MVSTIATSSATRTGFDCGTMGPRSAIVILWTRAAMYAADTMGAGVRMRGE